MIRRIVNLPFRVLGKAARAFQDRHDNAAGEANPEASLSREEELENIPEFDTPSDFATGATGLAVADVRAAISGDQPVQLVDVRSTPAYSQDALPDAIHLPLATLGIRLAELPPIHVKVVVYGTANEAEVVEAARFLRWRGFEDAWHLEGGLQAWKANPDLG